MDLIWLRKKDGLVLFNVHENRAEIPACTVPVVLPVTQLRLIK